ncbi:hypothetical protein PM10SUCC1_38270 [Propionigenium maris DSM 9537]|uniref:AAA+ ATPase domain-containing protein n=1 Tax=Propionigenium maris DSM 9537 TaxID=1123000 RepID=A0A9W6GNI2_9FUSO|nr:AAA family ATPase [Propionigenium maris]GLI58313.1 hypothetical protein PM10SUCC1_38270 [Propionigenium maris DSM 9537]
MAVRLSFEEKRKAEETKNNYMIGILASKEDEYFKNYTLEGEPIYLPQKGDYDNIHFYIKPVCQEPKIMNGLNNSLNTKEYYIGQDSINNRKALGLGMTYTYSSFEDKIELIRKKLEGKLIIFKPRVKLKENIQNFNTETKEYRIYKNIEIIGIEDLPKELSSSPYFERVPQLSYSNKVFEDKLDSGDYIDFVDLLVDTPGPEHIICNDYIYTNFKIDLWESKENNSLSRRLLKGKDKWKKFKIKEFIKTSIKVSENLWFIDDEYLCMLMDQLEEEEYSSQDIIGQEEEIHVPKAFIQEDDLKEYDFLNAFKIYTESEGLSYNSKDLYNFHICLKTNLLTILTGMTGTGKSKLARAYAKMLDLSETNENLLFLPVSPNFTEPSDVLGYMNTSTGIYIPSETGLTDILIKASRNPEKIHLVIFDEMNLSQVEHWFAPFISLLEEKEENRYLRLYSDQIKCINDFLYPSKIKIGSNIRFIGTMNIDETTRDISDRLLDRANTITLIKNSFADLKSLREEDFSIKKENYKKNICTTSEEYNSWIDLSNPYESFKGSDLEFLDALHNLITKYDYQKGVSFRVLERIGIYLNNIPKNNNGNPVITNQEAIDLQIKQRIISKLKGTVNQFGDLIGSYEFENDEISEGLLKNLFSDTKVQSISSFEHTLNELKRKSKELTLYGYTS